jgi:hypothetical protein
VITDYVHMNHDINKIEQVDNCNKRAKQSVFFNWIKLKLTGRHG